MCGAAAHKQQSRQHALGRKPTALPCPPTVPFSRTVIVGMSELGSEAALREWRFTSPSMRLPGMPQSDRGRITLARFYSRVKLLRQPIEGSAEHHLSARGGSFRPTSDEAEIEPAHNNVCADD